MSSLRGREEDEALVEDVAGVMMESSDEVDAFEVERRRLAGRRELEVMWDEVEACLEVSILRRETVAMSYIQSWVRLTQGWLRTEQIATTYSMFGFHKWDIRF